MMNWSMTTWAPLAKSPNWASHSTSVSGASALELLDELGVDGEAVGDREELVVEHAQALGGHGGLDLGRRRAVELVLAGRLLDLPGLLRGLDAGLEALVQLGEVVPDLLLL